MLSMRRCLPRSGDISTLCSHLPCEVQPALPHFIGYGQEAQRGPVKLSTVTRHDLL